MGLGLLSGRQSSVLNGNHDVGLLGRKRLLDIDMRLLIEQVLGLGMVRWAEEQVTIPAQVQALVDARQIARQTKNFPESDRLRDEILKLGFVVKDTPQGIVVKRK